jgi:dTDP-4-dehydrorhamnose reductase
MKILVIGGGGQLGTKIVEQAQETHTLYATYMTRKPPLQESQIYQVDKTDRNAIQGLIRRLEPDAIIDTAAIHNVDYCETHREEAYLVNVEGTRNVAESCRSVGAKMVFVSTDYVFDGGKGLYKETDPANPINYYGQSKLDGEAAIKKACDNYAIARTSVIYSWVSISTIQSSSGKPLNFAMWLTQKLGKGESVNIVTDQYSSPTLADSLAQALIRLCEGDVTGLFHAAGKTRLNRYEFTLKLAEKMGYDTFLVNPVDSSSLKQAAARPIDSSLHVGKIERVLGLPMPTIDQALTLFASQSKEGKTR